MCPSFYARLLHCFILFPNQEKIWSPKHFFYFYIIFCVFSDFGPKYGDCTNLLAVRVTRWDRREPCRMSGQVHWGPLHTQNCAVLKKISSCNMAPLNAPLRGPHMAMCIKIFTVTTKMLILS